MGGFRVNWLTKKVNSTNAECHSSSCNLKKSKNARYEKRKLRYNSRWRKNRGNTLVNFHAYGEL